MFMSRAKLQPTRKVVDGVEYFSLAAAAEAVGRDKRTMTRLEKAGVLPRPEHVLPGDPRQRWYTQTDLDMLRRVSDQTGFRTSRHRGKEFVAALTAEKQRRSEGGEKPATPWQRLVSHFTQEEHRPTVRRWDDIEHGVDRTEKATPEKVDPFLCPCGRELVWRIQKLPGGVIQQQPWCDRHGPVDLSEPPPSDPNACPECSADLVWEIDNPHVGFQPTCPSCGPVTMPPRARSDVQEQAFVHEVAFGVTAHIESGRARGLQLGDLPGATRAPRPQPGPRIMFIDPHPGVTRRG
jgi:hypothetical protein